MIRLFEGDSLDVLRATPDGTYTYVISDPPYGLSTPPDPLEVMRQWLADGDFHRKAKGGKGKAGGFMGAEWDHFVPGPILWREVFRTCKPGAIVLCFAATRTMAWMSLSLCCAGFEILDTIAWLQAQGMAKAGTLDKKIDARNGDERPVVGPSRIEPRRGEDTVLHPGGAGFLGDRTVTAPASAESAAWAGWSTQLAPGYEPIIVARRPCEGTATANVLRHGCGAMNIDACRIGDEPRVNAPAGNKPGGNALNMSKGMPADARPTTTTGRWPKNVLLSGEAAAVLDATVPHSRDGVAVKRNTPIGKVTGQIFKRGNTGIDAGYGGGGGVSRFFWVGPLATEDDTASPARYVPKVRTAERHAGLPEGVKSTHPTVKPQALMEWLCRLVGHPQGRGLDPFAGSGSTLRAARALGLAFDGIERDPTFAEIARHRAGIHGEAPASPTPPCETPPDCPEEWDSALEREAA